MSVVAQPTQTGFDVPAPVHGVCVGRRAIGSDCDVYVIAEAGVNHNGDEATALRMVAAAADAGVDAVKFQMFTAGALTTATARAAAYQREHTSARTQYEMLSALELSSPAFARIASRCAECGVAFIATPFSVSDVRRTVEAGSAAIKIASTDIVDVSLLDRACRAGLPIIMSTGAADAEEITDAVGVVERLGARDRLILMHCVSAYPTPMTDANLRAIGTLRRRFDVTVGFSDHTTPTFTGAVAVAAGACVLEKHFTLDAGACGPDHAMSLEPAALAEYVRLAREAHAAMGRGALGCQEIEREVRMVGRKVVVASRAIPAGAIITAQMLTTKRAGRGLEAASIARLIGRRTVSAIPADTALSREHLG